MKQFIHDVLMYDGFDALECCNVERVLSQREVSTALETYELVRPFPSGGLNAS